jgi:hypothetical protein
MQGLHGLGRATFRLSAPVAVIAAFVDLNGDHVCGGGDPQGTLTFTHIFTGKEDTVTLAEIRGRCHHVVAAGTGAFPGASGVISFHDDVATGTAPYKGHVTLT